MKIDAFHLVSFFIIALLAGSIYVHEVTHQVIFSKFGVESEIVIGNPLEGTLAATVSHPGNISEETRNAIVTANSFNEIVGYNITPFLVILTAFSAAQFFVLMKISAQLEVRQDAKEENCRT